MRSLSLDCELDDRSFVTTSNDRETNTTSAFPGVSRVQLPIDTSPKILLENHTQHMLRVLASKLGVQPLVFRTIREVLASQNRSEALKSAHRANPNFDYRAELSNIMGRDLNKQEREVASEVQRLRNQ